MEAGQAPGERTWLLSTSFSKPQDGRGDFSKMDLQEGRAASEQISAQKSFI
jgi:hypothetical protein